MLFTMLFTEFHHHLHQNGLPPSGGGKTVRVGPHFTYSHGRQTTATAGQVRGHVHSHMRIHKDIYYYHNTGFKEVCSTLVLFILTDHFFLDCIMIFQFVSIFSLFFLLA